MGEVLVEVFFQDKLQSIRVDQQQVEIPNAIKEKSVKEWFEPATGRVKWAGLAEEIRRMNYSGVEDSKFIFRFSGPEAAEQEFMACIGQYHLGEEAEQENEAKNAQDYLLDAEDYHKAGNEIMAFQNYKIAAEEYGLPEAEYEVAKRYQDGIGVEKNEEQAFVWYSKAAEQDYEKSQYQLGECYYHGTGIKKIMKKL